MVNLPSSYPTWGPPEIGCELIPLPVPLNLNRLCPLVFGLAWAVWGPVHQRALCPFPKLSCGPWDAKGKDWFKMGGRRAQGDGWRAAEILKCENTGQTPIRSSVPSSPCLYSYYSFNTYFLSAHEVSSSVPRAGDTTASKSRPISRVPRTPQDHGCHRPAPGSSPGVPPSPRPVLWLCPLICSLLSPFRMK